MNAFIIFFLWIDITAYIRGILFKIRPDREQVKVWVHGFMGRIESSMG